VTPSTPTLAGAARIVGIGETAYSRESGRSEASMASEAILRAVADAGLDIREVDGLTAYSRTVPLEDMASALRLPELRFTGSAHMSGASSIEALHLAALALSAGVASVVVAYCSRNGSSGPRVAQRVAGRAPGREIRSTLEAPYGWTTPAQWFAMVCRRHMIEFGTTKNQLGLVATTMRDHAQLNPRALMYGRSLSLAEYHAAAAIADPFQKFDCCLESDGAAAVVLTTPDRANKLDATSVSIEGIAMRHAETPDDLVNRTNWFASGVAGAASEAFEMAGLGVEDVAIALLYDCFTFEVIHQLEEMGFCAPGEGGQLVESGAIRLDGRIPVNPHGGLLSEAHVLGMNHVIEGVRQLRGEAGARQIDSAQIAAVTGWGGMADGGVAVLRRRP
jgi:acetyl-CoA acetyltransferase